jgi:hypothetical protein
MKNFFNNTVPAYGENPLPVRTEMSQGEVDSLYELYEELKKKQGKY